MRHTKKDLAESLEAGHSENLKKTMRKIKGILKSRGLAASVILYEPGFSEYLSVIDPIYSTVRFGKEKGQLQILDDLETYHGDEQARMERMEATMNMLVHLANMSRVMFQNFNNMARLVETKARVYGNESAVTEKIIEDPLPEEGSTTKPSNDGDNTDTNQPGHPEPGPADRTPEAPPAADQR